MRIKILFSKNWQIISMIHHLFGPPYSLFKNHYLASALFLFSRDFHNIYELKRILRDFEREKFYKTIWEFSPLGEGKVSKDIKRIIKKIRVYGWREIKEVLKKKSKILEEFFNKKIKEAKKFISQVFLIDDFS